MDLIFPRFLHSKFLELNVRCLIICRVEGQQRKHREDDWVPPRTRTKTFWISPIPNLETCSIQHISTCTTEVLCPFSLTRYISGLHGVVVTSEFYGSMQRLLGRMGRWPSHMNDARCKSAKMQEHARHQFQRLQEEVAWVAQPWVWFLHVFACNVCSKACVVCIGIFWIRFLPASLMMFQFHGSSAANRCRKWSRIGIV